MKRVGLAGRVIRPPDGDGHAGRAWHSNVYRIALVTICLTHSYWPHSLRLLENSCFSITSCIKEKINVLKEKLNSLVSCPAFKHPLEKIEQQQQDIDILTHSISMAINHIIDISEEKFATLVGKLKALNPLSILKRGFSLTTDSRGEIIKDANLLKKDDTVNTKLAKGSFRSKVLDIGS